MVKNANSQASPRPIGTETLGTEPGNLGFNNSPGNFHVYQNMRSSSMPVIWFSLSESWSKIHAKKYLNGMMLKILGRSAYPIEFLLDILAHG